MSIQDLFSFKNLNAETESLTPRVRHQREKQILLGCMTQGYLKMRLVTQNALSLPDLEGSKRYFDAKVSVWRVELHKFDDVSVVAYSEDDLKKVLEEVGAKISKGEFTEEFKLDLCKTLQKSSEVVLAELSETPSSNYSSRNSSVSMQSQRSLSLAVSDDEFAERVEECWRQVNSSANDSGNQAQVPSLWDHGSIWRA